MRALLLLSFLVVKTAFGDTVPARPCPSRLVAEDEKKETIGYLFIGKDLCSGTLISPSVVLTAAHCVEGHANSKIFFTLNPDLTLNPKRADWAPVTEVRIHPQFKIPGGNNPGGGDLAIVQLGSVNYGRETISFYSLADSEDLNHGDTAYTLGYGVDGNGSVKIRRSRKIRFDEKKDAYLRNGTTLKGGMYRFLRGDEGEIPCGGDSGSPILKFLNGKTSIIAVHSAAEAILRSSASRQVLRPRNASRLCQIAASAYSTSVFPYRQWIETNRAELETDTSHPRCPTGR